MYAVIQNVAVTDRYGVSVVTVNLLMMSFVAFVWLRDCWKGETAYTFDYLNWKTAWLIPVALFCLWFPINLQTAQPDFNPVHLFTGVSAMVGLIIGCYNMGQFATPNGLYLGIYHLPLLLVSLYVLLSSRRIKKE